jgi:hypothetical protein
MKARQGTNQGQSYEYFYDTNIRLWTIYEVDFMGEIQAAYYEVNIEQLFTNYPEFKLTHYKY